MCQVLCCIPFIHHLMFPCPTIPRGGCYRELNLQMKKRRHREGSVTWLSPHSWQAESQVWSRDPWDSQPSAPNCSEILLPFFSWRVGEPERIHLPSLPNGGVGGGRQGARGQSFPSRCRAERPETAQTFRYTNCGASVSWNTTGQ